MVAELEPHLFSVEEYMRLEIEDRTELLGGVIYNVSPKNEPHSFAVYAILRRLNRVLDDAFQARGQDPIALSGWTGRDAPEIDVAVITAKKYATTPTSDDAHAFIEVSDTTYSTDRKVKIPLLIGTGVPTWHVNVRARQVEYYARGATSPRVFAFDETFEVLGVAIRVSDLFAE